MAQDAFNTEEQKRLEQEALECKSSGDSLGALDVYEEMVRKGLAEARHMLALGHCYIENRQRQNARTIWLRALDIEPENPACIEALDHYFAGWRKATEEPAPPRTFTRPRVTPPPPPPPSDSESTGGLTISVETTQTRQSTAARAPQSPPQQPPEPQAPPQQAAAQPEKPRQPQPARTVTTEDLESTQVGMKSADAAIVPPAIDLADPRAIRWDYVMKDSANEASLHPRAHAHH